MTEKIFYLAPEQMSLETLVSKVKKREGRVALSFPQTIFFPEGGGQPADRGMIRGERWWMEVEDVSEEGGEIWHWGKMQGREPEEGEKVFMRVDEEWRRMMCEQHTAQHLFSAILERDYALSTTGFSILPDRIKIEIPCRDDLSPTVLQEAETKVRAFIRKRLPVSIYWENSSMRIVEIPGLDRNPCGGLHVSDTGYIGSFAILRFYRKNRDFWRIEFLAGGKLERAFRQMMETVDTLHTMLGNNLVEGTLTLLEKKGCLEEEVRKLRQELNEVRALLLENQAEARETGKFIVRCLSYDFEDIRAIAKKLQEKDISCLLWNERGQLVSHALSPSWGERMGALLAECGFRGTRTPHFAQGKVENVSQLFEFVKGME